MCNSASVADTDCAAAIEHCRDDEQTARVDAQIEGFVLTAAAAANKQNDKYNPGTIAAAVAAVVIE